MDKLFLTVLNMSLTGSVVIAAICIARLFLKKAPKSISYMLWAVAAFRLIVPFSVESLVSLIPFKSQPIPLDIAAQPVPRIDSGLVIIDNFVSNTLPAPAVGSSVNPLQVWIALGAYVWLIGALICIGYAIVSYRLLKLKMRRASFIKENIYESENIASPFVLGLISPKIYMPLGLSEKEKSFIIAHEKTHIKRADHIIKFAAYSVLCVHWFNPLVWAAFWLMGKDMEMSCDERVLKELGLETKAEYSRTLLALASPRRIISGSPLAFGESGVKARLKNILSYKKPALWAVIAAFAAIAAVGIGLAVNPKTKAEGKYYIMTDEVGAIGCEYGVSINNELDTPQMLEKLEAMNGFKLDEAWAEHGYIKFNFLNDVKPKQIYLRYCADIDDIWQQEYPIDSAEYKIKVPSKKGNYSFFADITWENGQSETAYFSITVGRLIDPDAPQPFTEQSAREFINQALSTFTLSPDYIVSFTLPQVMPSAENTNTRLFITSSATFSPEPGFGSVQEILDMQDGWQGGEVFSEKLDTTKGKLTRLFLRIAFMTEESENSYREYAANYIELTEPFVFDSPLRITDKSLEISADTSPAALKYTTQTGTEFTISLTLPGGITLSSADNYPEYAQQAYSEMPAVVAVKDNAPVGILSLSSFGTADKESLALTITDENTLPMQIFAPIAMSNHAMFDNYTVRKSTKSFASATADYLWQDLTDYSGDAIDAPWLKSVSVLAYDYEKLPFFISFNFADESITAPELEALAKSIEINA